MHKRNNIRNFFKGLLIISGIILSALAVFFFYKTNVTENTDSYVYALPFKKGDAYRVVQGYGGLFSHTHIAALDFEMPVGTPIHAAREGEIYSYKSDSESGGVSPKHKGEANYIIIRHRDGSFGCYWHLKKDGVVTKTGRVQKGQLIGYSGATGQVLRPHLHFSVKRVLNYDKDSFVKTKFTTSDGVVFLTNGREYRE
jgi:murein DD-endopeptidase MepM/ murein hydrolase activator NlpD